MKTLLRVVLASHLLIQLPAAASPQIIAQKSFELTQERMALQSLVLNGNIYFLGGYTYPEDQCLTSVSSWSQTEGEKMIPMNLLQGRNHFELAALDSDRAIVLGGFNDQVGSLATVELLNFSDHTVKSWPDLPNPVELFSVNRVGDQLVVIGGLRAQKMMTWNTIQLIDLKTGQTSLNPEQLNTSRFGHESLWLPELQKVLIVGGKNLRRGDPGPDGKRPAIFTSLTSLEFWDPLTGHVSPAGDLKEARDRPALQLLNDGKVLIIGGATSEPNAKSVATLEIYDPKTLKSEIVAQMSVGRMAALSIPYQDKGVIISGGWVSDPSLGNLIEYYDFASQKVSVIGKADSSRAEHQMLWISDDQFILVGGKDNFGDKKPESYHFKTLEIFQVK